MSDDRIVTATPLDDDSQFDVSLRPKSLGEFIGQATLKENLSIAIEAARKVLGDKVDAAAAGKLFQDSIGAVKSKLN